MEWAMIRRPGDKTAEPPGGRAAERLRMFEQARRGNVSQEHVKKKKVIKRKPRSKKVEGDDEEQTRRKD
jgi:hypothetical protein